VEAAEFRSLFEYDYWANREALASLSALDGDTSRATRFFNHVLGAQEIWLSRFETPDTPSTNGWPALSFADERAALDDLHRRWINLLVGLTPEKLAADLAYRNTKGLEFKTPVRDVLMHLIVHSAYHRGQVAAAVRDSGGKPAPTDYVVYVRQIKNS
jgi:uncharacterized damage-inducible protein DinB